MPLKKENLIVKLKKHSILITLALLFGSFALFKFFVPIGSKESMDSLNQGLEKDQEVEEYFCTKSVGGSDQPWMTFKRIKETIELDKSNIYDLRLGNPVVEPVILKKDYFEVHYLTKKPFKILLNFVEETPSRLVFGAYILPSYNFFVLDKSSMKIFRGRSSVDAVGGMRDYKRWAVLGKCEIKEPLKPLITRTTEGLKDRLIKLSKTRIRIINLSDQ